jgi:hypothetical protein
MHRPACSVAVHEHATLFGAPAQVQAVGLNIASKRAQHKWKGT